LPHPSVLHFTLETLDRSSPPRAFNAAYAGHDYDLSEMARTNSYVSISGFGFTVTPRHRPVGALAAAAAQPSSQAAHKSKRPPRGGRLLAQTGKTGGAGGTRCC
jgi:hypothetical protein